MRNLSELLLHRAERRPDALIGVDVDAWRLADLVGAARGLAHVLGTHGLVPGRRVALVGSTSTTYIAAWAALQLAGASAAMVNPEYPGDLLTDMFEDLDPHAVVWIEREAQRGVAPSARHLAVTSLSTTAVSIDGHRCDLNLGAPVPGLDRHPLDAAGFMHTSGTSGRPKFCVQSHEYYLRLGRVIADAFCLSSADTVYAPLPMFHINPLGYGLIGGLTGYSSVMGSPRFSASGFWPAVKRIGATVLVLHAPPIAILKRRSGLDDAAGHSVRAMFFADAEFFDRFEIPLALSCYGSTEAGGVSHLFTWRHGDDATSIPEGMSRYGGQVRPDIEWRLGDDDEILVRPRDDGAMFGGYVVAGEVSPATGPDGWFHTGDVGRVDERGRLVFIERRSEAVRVKGEFVPLSFVEERFTSIPGVDDAALWRRPSTLVDDELVLFLVATTVPVDAIRSRCDELPAFMRPSELVAVAEIPRDSGVGKVRRRLLAELPQKQVWRL